MSKLINLRKLAVSFAIFAIVAFGAGTAKADNFEFHFVGTVNGQSVDGTAQISAMAGSNVLQITLTNNIANINDVGQAISGFTFQVCDAFDNVVIISPIAITTQTADRVQFSGGNQTATDLGVQQTTWTVTAVDTLNALGAGAPDDTILGPPTSGLLWGNANGSITNSPGHQPFANTSIVFSVTLGTDLPTGFEFCSTTMFFGTVPGRGLTNIPEPASMLLLGTGLIGIAAGLRRRLKK